MYINDIKGWTNGYKNIQIIQYYNYFIIEKHALENIIGKTTVDFAFIPHFCYYKRILWKNLWKLLKQKYETHKCLLTSNN